MSEGRGNFWEGGCCIVRIYGPSGITRPAFPPSFSLSLTLRNHQVIFPGNENFFYFLMSGLLRDEDKLVHASYSGEEKALDCTIVWCVSFLLLLGTVVQAEDRLGRTSMHLEEPSKCELII